MFIGSSLKIYLHISIFVFNKQINFKIYNFKFTLQFHIFIPLLLIQDENRLHVDFIILIKLQICKYTFFYNI